MMLVLRFCFSYDFASLPNFIQSQHSLQGKCSVMFSAANVTSFILIWVLKNQLRLYNGNDYNQS